MKHRIGVDIGVRLPIASLSIENGKINTFKESSTPEDESIGLYNVINKAAQYFGKSLEDFLGEAEIFAHGTTVATNTLLTGTACKNWLDFNKRFPG